MSGGSVRRLGTREHGADLTTVHLFGGPYISIGDERIDVPGGCKRILTLVALRRRRMERRHAAGVLWPDCDDGRAAGNLRSALWRLRGTGIDVVSADKCSIALRSDVAVDVEIANCWAGRLIDGTAAPVDFEVLPMWAEALNLLPGWYDDWALIERERSRQRMLHGLEALSRCLIGAGRYVEAVEAASLAVTAEPLRESAQRRLIEAHLANGNRVEALRSFFAFRRILHEELGIRPSVELETLAGASQRPHYGALGKRMLYVRT